jgi:signal peptidase II
VSRSATRAWWLAAGLCLAVLAVDQVAKAIVEHNIVLGERVDVLGPLRLTLSHNDGVAFGIAGGSGWPLIAVTFLALGVVVYLFARDPARPWMWVATGLLAGGAIGNLADRIRLDYVTDFVQLPHWPAFNLADMAITCGVVVLILIYVREAEREAGGEREADGA